jgi:hypothetical protein
MDMSGVFGLEIMRNGLALSQFLGLGWTHSLFGLRDLSYPMFPLLRPHVVYRLGSCATNKGCGFD